MTAVGEAASASAVAGAAIASVGDAKQQTTANVEGKQNTSSDNASRETGEEAGEDDYENQNRPKGVKFAILFLCILLGDFFVGYVRPLPPQRVVLSHP